jgi:iron complex transport system substrate-binding protein
MQYVWAGWSDGGSQTHTYTVSNGDAIVTADYKTQYQVVFEQSGLENVASGTVVSVSIGGANPTQMSYANLPYSSYVDAGTQITYNYQSNVSTSISGWQYNLGSITGPSSPTVYSPLTITGNYPTRTITDMAGRLVTLPSVIANFSTPYPGYEIAFAMLGIGDKEVAGNAAISTGFKPIFDIINPNLENISKPYSGASVNIETLLAANPTVVFLQPTDSRLSTITTAGFPVVEVYSDTKDHFLSMLTLYGNLFGGNATAKVNEYISYLNGAVSNITSTIGNSQKPTVMYAQYNNGWQIGGNNTLIGDWIVAAGGVNIAADLNGYQTLTMETILQKYNPDIIITEPPYYSQLMNDSGWQTTNAVQNGRVMQNPSGIYNWDGVSIEFALEPQWLSWGFYPDQFSNANQVATLKYFYSEFLNVSMSDATINAILEGATPPF